MRAIHLLPVLILCWLAAMPPVVASAQLNMHGMSPEAPLGNWIVGPIRMSGGSKASYCSMKNSYPGSHMLIFARNAEGGNSFAFDFGEKKLVAGGQYPVRLDLGPLSRNMVGIAATTHILILQMGADKPFYDLLGQGHVLRAVIDGAERRYGLTAAGEALAALERCVAAQIDKKDVKAVEIPVHAASSAKDDKRTASQPLETASLVRDARENSLQDEIEILRAQNRKLLLENQRMSSETQRKAAPPVQTLPVEPLVQDGPAIVPAPVVPVTAKAQPEQMPPLKESVPKEIKTWLAAAGLEPKAEGDALAWSSGNVGGRVVALKPAAGKNPAQSLDGYFGQAEYACDGDFARNRSGENLTSGFSVVSGEAACIDGADDAGKAVVLLQKKDRLFIVDFSASAADMAAALEQRDRFMAAMSGK